MAGNPLVYHFRIGEIDAWSISDADLSLGDGIGLMWPEEDRPQMKEWLEEHGEAGVPVPLYVNILLIRIGEEYAIFDAGFGKQERDNMGWMIGALAGMGIDPAKVTAGFLSHSHADHLQGFVLDGKPFFPNAAFYYLQEEYDFWHAETPDFSKTMRNQAELPGMIRSVREQFEVLRPNWQPVKPGTSLFNGAVTVELAPGHTDGHAVFRIRSGNESLFHLSDMAHHHGFMFHDPAWTIAFDHDPEVSVEVRKKYFKQAAAERVRCFGFHLPWPGLGQIVPAGNGYIWHVEPWRWTA